MSIGKQPFDLPINSVKKETSLINKFTVYNIYTDRPDENRVWDMETDHRIHTQSVKIKFFIAGIRWNNADTISTVARWVELEPNQYTFMYPIPAINSVSPGILNTFFFGFYPYKHPTTGRLVIRVKLWAYPDNTKIARIYIEKMTMIDSDFDSDDSWLNDDSVTFSPKPGDPAPEPPDPVDPVGPFSPNCVWPF